jgi:hypothetical protein
MAEKLVIVESPAKAKTIQKYLGRGFRVEASMGHVRDLPKSDLGVDVERGFAPVYEVSKGKEKVVASLRKSIRQADAVYLATDPDREGEAIAWHITQAAGVKGKPVYRVEFSEITRNAVQQAIAHPRQIDGNLVDAQQARRVLDRLVGYKLSPLLWEKVMRGLSAGRVQSVAVRLVVEREADIEAFVPQEYWTIEADLAKRETRGLRLEASEQRDQASSPQAQASNSFRAVLIERAGKKLDKFAIENQDAAHAIVDDLDGADYVVRKITRKDKKRDGTGRVELTVRARRECSSGSSSGTVTRAPRVTATQEAMMKRVAMMTMMAVGVLAGVASASDLPAALVDPYLQVQAKLAGDQFAGIAPQAQAIATAAAALGKDAEKIAAGAKKLGDAKDIAAARTAFGEMSQAIADYAAKTKSGFGPDVKLAYCPMADKPWLQKEKDIKNPYYGAAMSTCGTFK